MASGKRKAGAAQPERGEELVDELNDVGVELKDYPSGLVDFVARHDGRDVYLCWKLGEERITLCDGFFDKNPAYQAGVMVHDGR